jgi:hypothetical protein
MLSKNTVFILGAGASRPYDFKTGRGQLDWARSLGREGIATYIKPCQPMYAPPLYSRLVDTAEKSIDAMLPANSPLLPAAKALIVNDLLRCERNLVIPPSELDTFWYRTLWENIPRGTLNQFRRAPLTIFTFNYDRSLDYFLWRGLVAAFPDASPVQIAEALDSVGPFHLHGHLGRLYHESNGTGDVVQFGGDSSEGGVMNANVQVGIDNIKLISETTANDESFVRAQNAISAAQQLVFLGFGFHNENITKLSLRNCLNAQTSIWGSAYGLTEQQTGHLRTKHGLYGTFGQEGWGVARCLAMFPQILD